MSGLFDDTAIEPSDTIWAVPLGWKADNEGHDPISMHANGGLPHLVIPTGGAGPVERRLISEAEREVRTAAVRAPSPIAPRPRPPIPSPTQEEPVMPADPDPVAPRLAALAALREAVTAAAEASAALELAERAVVNARLAWLAARHDLDAAYQALDQGPPLTVPPVDPRLAVEELVPLVHEPTPTRPTAEGGRATEEQLQRSRRNGQAQMQRVTAEKAALGVQQQRILDAVVRLNGDRKAAAKELNTSDANVIATLRAVGKKGLLPIDLIPKLPAGFAQFTGV